jgi:3-deoxy-D-arabino-heptulosonate 7-phosphate (DAHP) synthase class II
LAVVHHSDPQHLTFHEIKNELKTRGFDVTVKQVEASVLQLRKLGYLSTNEEKE